MTGPKRQFWPVFVLGMVILGTTPAAAQSRSQHRVEISGNAGAQIGASEFTESSQSTFNGETETLTVDHGVKTALGFNVGAAVRIVPSLWMGVQYAMADMKSSASITAVIPHPLVFNAPRTVQGSSDDVTHNEQNVHVELMYALPFHAMDIRLMGGPTFFNVKQDFVSDVVINESYPFDTATFAGATTKQLSKGAVGFNVGADISRLITSQLGIGALIRYSRADMKFNDADIGTQTVRAGGTEVTAGVRFRF
jgi:opacity protein-like surface antigen